uniref:Uncharacterized protein n=1 Tax=viral metagenome TaxID=1070528 RepID=A0A6M3L9V9_9ZZZZ
MRCPRDGSKLYKIGISLACKRCSYKIIQPSKKWVPELHWKKSFPADYDWSSFTTTNATISGGTVTISTGETQATLISPQFTNLTRSSTQLRDFTKILIEKTTGSLNDGKITLSASNDGGTTWVRIKDNGHIYDLNYGNEDAGGGTKQSKYSDLRIRIILKRQSASDTSPSISLFNIAYNHIPDDGRRVF